MSVPFSSDKQRKFMYVHHPDIAERWTKEQKRKKKPLVVGKLAEHVEIEQGLSRIYGKSKGLGTSNVGATPAPYDPIPDYAEIYYQPDDDPRREDETEARATRREAMGVANRGKYGFHGTADAEDTPILRYETDDYPQNAPRRNPSPNERRAAIVTPNKYPQPVETGPVKHSVPREKLFGKQAKVATMPQRKPKTPEGGGDNFIEDKQMPQQRAAKPTSKKPVPVISKEKFASRPAAVKQTKPATVPPASPRPPAYTRAGH